MKKRLVRHGNSQALVIDRPVLELLKADAETVFDLSTDGAKLILAPIREPEKRRAFEAALDDLNARHGEVLRRLAR